MAIKNRLGDLNNYLFAQIERLDDENITQEEFEKEIARTKALTDVAKTIVANGNLMLNAQKHADEYGCTKRENQIPELLGIGNEK